jgi:hypothetical protein
LRAFTDASIIDKTPPESIGIAILDNAIVFYWPSTVP